MDRLQIFLQLSLIVPLRTWMNEHRYLVACFMLWGAKAQRFFWRRWPGPLAHLVLTHPHAPHAGAALMLALIIKGFVWFWKAQEKQAKQELARCERCWK
jgi:glyoxylase-like metal-dependent hydrolase (beta-lactamase superfamily II)